MAFLASTAAGLLTGDTAASDDAPPGSIDGDKDKLGLALGIDGDNGDAIRATAFGDATVGTAAATGCFGRYGSCE